MNKDTKLLIICVLLILLILFLYLAFLLVPYYYGWFFGDKVLNAHVEEVVGNETDPKIVSVLLMDWVHENVHYPQLEENRFLINPYDGSGLYNINNETRLFLRNGHPSWLIKTKLGRCGEDARYFVKVMDYLGHEARVIQSEGIDHALAEYTTSEGYKIVVDPSSNQVGIDLTEWASERNVTKIMAEYPDGKREDVTEEFL